jgi:hypothetical protein
LQEEKMTAESWIIDSLGRDKVRQALNAHDVGASSRPTDKELQFVAQGLELRAFALLESDDFESLRVASLKAFQVARAMPRCGEPIAAAEALLRLGCFGILADRSADVRGLFAEEGWAGLPLEASEWGVRVWATILEVWLRLLRRKSRADFDAVQMRVATLRREQRRLEPDFLAEAESRGDVRPAWELMSAYHLAKAAEILGIYWSQGAVDGDFDVRQQLDSQFDRAIAAAGRSQSMEREVLARGLARCSRALFDSISGGLRVKDARRFVGRLH